MVQVVLEKMNVTKRKFNYTNNRMLLIVILLALGYGIPREVIRMICDCCEAAGSNGVAWTYKSILI